MFWFKKFNKNKTEQDYKYGYVMTTPFDCSYREPIRKKAHKYSDDHEVIEFRRTKN